jgi:predicted Zn-dependent peptidase
MERQAPVLRFGRTAGALALAAAFAVLALASSPGAEDPERSFVLDNGIRVFLFEKRDLPLVHVVTGFDVGSKNETDAASGIVHLLEHCVLFRGTTARSGEEVVAEVRRHGAYFNAHTGQDLAVFEISVPAAEAGFALRNQRDILFGFAVTPEELEGEKAVILEELNQMEDDPRRNATDLVLQALFPGHPYGRSVYGRREAIAAATVEDLLGFYRAYFVPGNCAMAVVGDFAAADMERQVREVFGPLPKASPPAAPLPMAEPLKKSVSRRLEKDVEDGYLYLGFVAPDYNHADQYAVNVLTEVLGRGINPLLPGLIRSERDIVLTVDMAYLALRYGGAVIVSIKADPRDIPVLERLAVTSLRRAQGESYSKKDVPGAAELFVFDYLENAKNQIRFAVGRAEESGLQLAGSLVRYMLLNTREDPARYLDAIGRVDSPDLRKAAGKYFAKGQWAAVSIVPLKGAK